MLSKFEHNGVDLITSARVGAITPSHVLYTVKNAQGESEQHSIPSNFVLWSTGIAMNPFAERMLSLLPNQVCAPSACLCRTKESNHIAIQWAAIMSHVAMLWECGHPMAVHP
jgi:hypothetical protein